MDQVPECRPELVQAYADAQLSLTESMQLERHLGGCARCSALYENQKALGELIAKSGLYHRAPQSLLDRIEHSLGGAERSAPPVPVRREHFWRALALAASAAFVVVLSTTVIVRRQLGAP
jgi:anti-sigma factor RsiW